MIQSDLIHIMNEAMMVHKEELIALLIHQQYEEGVDSEGKPLRTYSPYYRLMKQRDGLYTGKTDFNLTGEFHADINLRIDNDTYEFESSATTANGLLKSKWLAEWNKSEIMELTPENKLLAWDICKDTFRDLLAQRVASKAA